MRVSINRAVVARGTSGSARGVANIEASLERLTHDVVGLDARPLRTSRLWNAAYQAQWDLFEAPRASRRAGAAVHVSPTNVGRGHRGTAGVVLIHDTMVLDRPDLFDRGYANYARLLFSVSARAADVVLCPSHYTAGRLRDRWPEIRDIRVAWWPVEIRDLGARSHNQFLVTVLGATEPHKRQSTAVEAVAIARARTGIDFRLAVVGPAGRAESDVVASLSRFDSSQSWAERLVDVPQAQLDDVISRTNALLQPSVFEGFGLPVAEASAAGIPVVHSGAGSLLEIAPSAAVADSAEEFADALVALSEPSAWEVASANAANDARRLSTAQFDRSLAEALESALAARR